MSKGVKYSRSSTSKSAWHSKEILVSHSTLATESPAVVEAVVRMLAGQEAAPLFSPSRAEFPSLQQLPSALLP
jgi:hypothetical protein